MIAKVAIDRQTRKGQHLVIGIAADGNWVQVDLDGKEITSRAGYGKAQPHNMGTEYIYQLGPVLLTAEDGRQIDETQEAQRAAYRLTPAGLRMARENLASEISGILAETERARNKAFERDMGGIPSYDSPVYRKAKAKLNQFDTEHPEIIAQIKAEREEMAARHAWD